VREALKVIQDVPDEAVQLHVDGVVTVTAPVPPPGGTVTVRGDTENVHGAPASLITKLLPAIVSVADRDCVVPLDAATYPTVPGPLRFAPSGIVTHDAVLDALHVQPLAVVTETVPLLPPAASDTLVGEIVNPQTPACVTVKARPATVTVPVREALPVLAPTLKVTDPLPVPLPPPLMLIHAALLTAVHAQPVAAVTLVLAGPPAADTDWPVGEMAGAHGRLNVKVFERTLGAAPPGPTALMTVS